MRLITIVDVNIFALLMLLFIYFDAKHRIENPSSLQHRLFMGVVYVLAALLVMDGLGRMFDGYQGPAYHLTNWIANIALYTLVPMAPAMWVLYCTHQVYRDDKKLKQAACAVAPILVANLIMALLSVRTGWFFTIDASNIYHRGPLFPLHMATAFAIGIYPSVILLANRRSMDPKHFYALLLFPVPTVIGSILQWAFYGTSLNWCCMTVSVMLIYLNIQAERLGTDYLTGVYNRRQLDTHVRGRIQSSTPKKTFSAILLDLDNFKSINDSFGHDMGDKALLDTVDLIRRNFRRGDFIARYGGDEVLIILDMDSQDVLEESVQRLRDSFDHFNRTSARPYKLGFTAGSAVYDMAGGMDPEQFIRHIDKLMYEKKKPGVDKAS